MKKTYMKPLVAVESMTLDMPIASNCTADKEDVMTLKSWGYFMDGMDCGNYLLPTGGFDLNRDGQADTHDTLCYHSNVRTAFTS